MNIVTIIPARGGSKGIHKKNLIDICGKPLVAWTIECALGSEAGSDVYVSTDDAEIEAVSKKYGAKVIHRPAELAGDTASSEDAILHAVSQIEQHKAVDLVIFLQATSPIRESKDIDLAVQQFVSEGADSLFSGSVLDCISLWQNKHGEFKSFTYDYCNRRPRQKNDKYYLENGSIYLHKSGLLKTQKNRLGGKISFYEMPTWKSFEIDTYDDVEMCEYFIRKYLLKKPYYNCRLGECSLIVYDFDGVLTDNKVLFRQDGLEAVVVNRADGLGINRIKDMGIEQLILSTEANPVVRARAEKVGLPVLQNIDNKKDTLERYCRDRDIALEDVAYIGNDINDLEVMKSIGCPLCPSDASEEIREIAKIILDVPGGGGVVRALLNLL